MSASARYLLRIESTQIELDRLREEMRDWLAECRKSDRDDQQLYIGRYKTQIDAIESVLLGSADSLEKSLSDVSAAADRPAGDVYEECRDHDQAIVWLRRVWGFFGAKFDRRLATESDVDVPRLLKAADEIVWSCYRPVFIQAALKDPSIRQGPAPLAFLSPDYSPAALMSDSPIPDELQALADIPGLDQQLRQLPVPILRLPPWCVQSPWWLVYIAHEVGHHVQHDLRLVKHFADGLGAAAATAGAAAADSKRWQAWGEEIFADVFSVLMIGPWALWSVSEAECAPRIAMLQRKSRYPAPVVRIELIARVVQVLGIEPPTDCAKVHFDRTVVNAAPASIASDLKVIPEIVEFALGPMRDNLGTLKELCAFDAGSFGAGGVIENWADHFSGTRPIGSPARQLTTARQAICGALYAWSRHVARDDLTASEAFRAQLRAGTLDMLPRCGPSAVRGPLLPPGARPQAGAIVAQQLLAACRGKRAAAVANSDAVPD